MMAKKKNGWVWREWLYLIAIVALFAWAMSKPKERILEVEVEREVIVERESEVYVVTATVYHAVEGQCDNSPLVTASGAKIKSAESAYEHRYLAVSRDLLDVFPYGTIVEVSGCGELDGIYCVVDTMAKRFKGYVDILINPDMRGGKWQGVRIRKVNSKN